MALSLVTEIGTLLFSSQIPDIVIATGSNDDEVEVFVDTGDTRIFATTHFPYGHSITVHDMRSVIEFYLRGRNISLDTFALIAKQGSETKSLATFSVLYLEHHFTGDIDEFLRNNFLTTMAGKLTSQEATEFLHFFLPANTTEKIRYQVVASIGDNEPRIFQSAEQCSPFSRDRLYKIEVTYEVMLGIVENPAQGRTRDNITVHAYSVHAGERAFTFYVNRRHDPELSLYFRNAFNLYERCDLHAVTTHKPKVDRQVAVTNRVSTFYNQQNEKQYEVETSGLTMEQARWIEQLFYSHDVRMATKRTDFSEETYGTYNPQYMPTILITDFTCEIHDRDGELNSVKFTYQYSDRRPLLPTDYLSVDHDRIFTNPYNPTFD